MVYSDYKFSLKPETNEKLSLDFWNLTYEDIKSLLSRIEYAKTGALPHAEWKVEAESFNVSVTQNGLSGDQLESILSDAYEGFKANEFGDDQIWPDSLDDSTKQIIKRIADRIRKVSPATIETIDKVPLRIEPTHTTKRIKNERYSAWSSIEGTLEVISVHKRPFFVIYEHGEDYKIQCTFPDDWMTKVLPMLGKRVIVEGFVYYRQSGKPYQLTNPSSIEIVPEPKYDLLALRGSIPGLTKGLSSEEYVNQLREQDELN
jgi:hypothetical protein